MADRSIHDVEIRGTYLAIPFSVSFAYQQVGDTDTDTPGALLLTEWFLSPAGPWQSLAPLLSAELEIQCGISTYDGQSDTVFFASGNGGDASGSMPSTHCLQIEIPATLPAPAATKLRGGRMYWPGIPVLGVSRSGYDAEYIGSIGSALPAWEEIVYPAGEQPGQFNLIPHAKYIPFGNDDPSLLKAFRPYLYPFVKVLQSRVSDECAAFVAGSPVQSPVIGGEP